MDWQSEQIIMFDFKDCTPIQASIFQKMLLMVLLKGALENLPKRSSEWYFTNLSEKMINFLPSDQITLHGTAALGLLKL